MDLYLEQPAFWASFHSRFMVAMADAIEALLDPAYYVEVEVRTYLSEANGSMLIGIPDAAVVQTADLSTRVSPSGASVAVQARPQRVTVPLPETVQERYLEIRELETGAVITAIELLSPANKRPGPGRNTYEAKRRQILASLTNLVELDLLRGGQPMAVVGHTDETPYRILISASSQRPAADLYGVWLRDPLPTIPIPLKPAEASILLDLQAVLAGVYDRGRYHTRIDYTQPPPPPALSPDTQAWLGEVLQKAGYR